MAIDYNAGINSIDVGASDITYSGDQGPKSPEQEQMLAGTDTSGLNLQPLEKYDQQIQQSFVRDVDSIVQKLNTSFQQDLKEEAEAEAFFMA